jgi:hypothetical protein
LLAAFGAAFVYRPDGAHSLGSLDGENLAEGRCPSRAQNLDRAGAYGELASPLAVRA